MIAETIPDFSMPQIFPFVTVQIAGTIFAQGQSIEPVDSFGRLPVNQQGFLVIKTGETSTAIGKPLLKLQVLASAIAK